jgi:hypothetical protein
LFEDDVKLYSDISFLIDVALLQGDLNALVNGCNSNCMFINQGKCQVMNYLARAVACQNHNDNVEACSPDFVMDIGVIFHKFDTQALDTNFVQRR